MTARVGPAFAELRQKLTNELDPETRAGVLADDLRRMTLVARVALDLAVQMGAPADLVARIKNVIDGTMRS